MALNPTMVGAAVGTNGIVKALMDGQDTFANKQKVQDMFANAVNRGGGNASMTPPTGGVPPGFGPAGTVPIPMASNTGAPPSEAQGLPTLNAGVPGMSPASTPQLSMAPGQMQGGLPGMPNGIDPTTAALFSRIPGLPQGG